MKSKSIVTRIVLPLVLILLACVAVQTVIIAVVSARTARSLSKEIAMESTERYESGFESLGAETYGVVNTIASVVADNIGAENGREEVLETLGDVLAANPGFISMWTVWEPDAFDGSDIEYAGQAPYGDGKGQFATAVFMDGNTIGYEVIDDYQEGEYYQGAKQRERMCQVHTKAILTVNGWSSVP